MTEPIRTQIDNFNSDVEGNHTELMDKLNDLSSSIVPPIDYGDTLTSIADKLDALQTTVGTIGTSVADMLELLEAYTIAETTRWNALALQTARLTTMDDNLQDVQQTLGLHTGGAEFTLASLTRAIAATVANLYTSLTPIFAPWPADMLAAMECVCESTRALLPPDPLDPALNPPCDSPYTSAGFNLFPAVPPVTNAAIIYATWTEPLPDGLEYGTSVLGDLSNGILTTDDWSGWNVFVQSTESQYADDPLQPERYPTNQWRTMSGSGARVFSVSERGSIKVYLCGPHIGLPTECVTLSVEPLTMTSQNGGSFPVVGVVWPPEFGGVTSSEGIGDNTGEWLASTEGKTVILEGDFFNWTVRPIGGTAAAQVSNHLSSTIGFPADVTTTITGHTQWLALFAGQAGEMDIVFCPPSGGS